jgi:hypothetical protein
MHRVEWTVNKRPEHVGIFHAEMDEKSTASLHVKTMIHQGDDYQTVLLPPSYHQKTTFPARMARSQGKQYNVSPDRQHLQWRYRIAHVNITYGIRQYQR